MTKGIEIILRCPKCGHKFLIIIRSYEYDKYKDLVFAPFKCDKCEPQTDIQSFINSEVDR